MLLLLLLFFAAVVCWFVYFDLLALLLLFLLLLLFVDIYDLANKLRLAVATAGTETFLRQQDIRNCLQLVRVGEW